MVACGDGSWSAGFGVPDPRKAHILVELKTTNAVKLMQYSTSQRVIAMPTAQLNARRSEPLFTYLETMIASIQCSHKKPPSSCLLAYSTELLKLEAFSGADTVGTHCEETPVRLELQSSLRLPLCWRRISRMVRNPVVGSISQMLLSFNSASQAYVENFPQMEGKTFGELFKW